MTRTLLALSLGIATMFGVTAPLVSAEYPTPSVAPTSWELDFQHGEPKRIVVKAPGDDMPKAYWYMTYRVTNNTPQERNFLPVFEMVTKDGLVIQSDRNIPPQVFDAVKQREKLRFLEPAIKIAGRLLVGEDQARDGVAIWPEPTTEMGRFSIFIEGLSGETTRHKIGDQEFLLRKEKQMDYIVRGDEVYPALDEVNPTGERWVMR